MATTLLVDSATHRQGKLILQNRTLVLFSPRADSGCIHQLVLTAPRLLVRVGGVGGGGGGGGGGGT